MAQSYEPDGTPSGRNYILYAYCLMSNHIHLLIREREDKIGMSIKRIASSYVYYYNHKYSRDGHLFRERFKSEPVRNGGTDTVLKTKLFGLKVRHFNNSCLLIAFTRSIHALFSM